MSFNGGMKVGQQDRKNCHQNRNVFIIMLLCLADALLTIRVIENGGAELNPFMDFFIQEGYIDFIIVKMFLTFLGLSILTKYKKYVIINYILILYILLILYHIYIY